MRGQVKWHGLSLALHLALIGLLALLSGKAAKQTKPVRIDFSLETCPLPASAQSAPLQKASSVKEASRSASAPAPVPASEAETARESAPAPPPMPLPAAPPLALAAVAKPVVNPPPQPTAQVAGQTIAAASSVAGQTDGADPHASTGEGHLTSEKAKNRYPREDFAYIRELIMKQLVYPGVARRMNWSGKVTLSFVIGEDGSVSGIRVVESSGYPLLDRSAMDAVKNVASFPKPLASAEIVMPIQFKLM